jgi:hypothetical protein
VSKVGVRVIGEPDAAPFEDGDKTVARIVWAAFSR